ncbi:MAG: NAD(P)H-dependent oxidoreductase subunit E, partial [Clostridiales bacterium]|nr:NAD(P)H-dependent oxidoreductase subunit E [Candidatus Coliplasma caballi]
MNLEELTRIREEGQGTAALRVATGKPGKGVHHVMICGGTGCTSSGSVKLAELFKSESERLGIADQVKVVRTGCFGLCALGPIVIVYPEGTFYSKVQADDVAEIVESHLKNGEPVKRLVYEEIGDLKLEEGKQPTLFDITFYHKQLRLALKNCGKINPEDINEYIAVDGYRALAKALTEMTPDTVIQTVLDSGLRGRGGAGFPTGKKWLFAKNPAPKKYVVCNADEGDPGAFMDRSILEGDPHTVLEAMAIAGYAIGADEGYICVRAEYPIAVKRLTIAIEQARAAGVLGKNIFGTGFNFDIQLRLGAGAFVCGEETALLTSIEGNRGEPRPRPPFPAVKGLFGKPTVINNVETYANICQIIL